MEELSAQSSLVFNFQLQRFISEAFVNMDFSFELIFLRFDSFIPENGENVVNMTFLQIIKFKNKIIKFIYNITVLLLTLRKYKLVNNYTSNNSYYYAYNTTYYT